MGLRDTALFLIVAVASPRWIATAAAAGPSSLVIWGIALLAFFVPLALATLELSSRYPEEGGIYVWTRRAFGGFAGFMTAWMYWASNLVYFPGLLYFTVANALPMAGPAGAGAGESAAAYIALSLAGLAIALGLNLRGLGVARWLHNAGAIATWSAVALLVAMAAALVARRGSATEFTPASLVPATGLGDVVFWSTIAFAFAGVESASLMGGEIRDARRTIPRAIAIAALGVTAFYVLGTAAVLVAIPAGEVSALNGPVHAVEHLGRSLALSWAGIVAAGLITVGNVGSVGAWLAAAARLPFVAGLDRYLPAAFARLHPRRGTPVTALLVQAGGTALFIVLGQTGSTVEAAYAALVSMAVIAYFVPFLFLFAALIRVQREPAGHGVLRVPGGPAVAVLAGSVGFATTALAIALALVPPSGTADAGIAAVKVAGSSLVLIAIGVALYLRGARRRMADGGAVAAGSA
jgi:amino acid transporter